MGRAGEESFLTFNVYKGVPSVVDELSGCGFVIFGMLGRDVVTCEGTYSSPLCVSFDVSR
jgi:hypothetical protein